MSKKQPENIYRPGIYRPLVKCLNCDLFQQIEITHGITISFTLCPNCRCKTLELIKIFRKIDHEMSDYPSYL